MSDQARFITFFLSSVGADWIGMGGFIHSEYWTRTMAAGTERGKFSGLELFILPDPRARVDATGDR